MEDFTYSTSTDSAYLYSIKPEEYILNKAEIFNNDTNIN